MVHSRKTSKSKKKTASSVDCNTNAASSVTSPPKREKSARCESQAGVKQVCLTSVAMMLERSSVTDLRFFPFSSKKKRNHTSSKRGTASMMKLQSKQLHRPNLPRLMLSKPALSPWQPSATLILTWMRT